MFQRLLQRDKQRSNGKRLFDMFVVAESRISIEVICGRRAAVENRDLLIGRQQPTSIPQNTEITVSMRICTAQGNNGAFYRLEKR